MNSTDTLNDVFERAYKNYSNRTAPVFFNYRMTYGELEQWAGIFAKFLHREGIGKGDRVAMLLPNCPQMVIAYLGALRAGAIVAALSPLESPEEVSKMVAQADPAIFISLKDFHDYNKTVATSPSFRGKMMVIGLGDFLSFFTGLLYDVKNLFHVGSFTGPTWVEMANCGAPRKKVQGLLPSDTALLQFTGGTTGILKAAELTHSNLVNNAEQAAAVLGEVLTTDSVFLGVLPMFHVYGLSVCMNIALSRGCKVILVPRFNAKEVIRLIEKERVTIMPAIPRIFSTLLREKAPASRYRSLKACFSGAGELNGKLKKEFEAYTGAKIFEGYGLSETSPVALVNTPTANKDGSLGRPVPGTEVKLVDEEICIRGPQVMKGYWNKPEETREVLSEDGWLATGDLGTVDEDGFYWFIDRKKDMIKIKGHNVYPSEIEKVIMRIGNVAEVAVVGIPDRDLGEKIVACVVLKDGIPILEPRLREQIVLSHCRKEGLDSIKMPQEIRFIKEIPKHPILPKVFKRKLREMLQGGR